MKNYTVPAMALLFAACLCVMGAAFAFTQARDAGLRLDNQALIRDGASLQLKAAQASSAKAQTDSVPVDHFLSDWKDQFKVGSDLSSIFNTLDTQAVNNLLSSSDKNNTQDATYLFGGKPSGVLKVSIQVSGDYSRILSWLGQIENTYPLARVEEANFTEGNSTTSMKAQITFPLFFPEEKETK
jgi:hypothetical protein